MEHGAVEAFKVGEIWLARIYQDARTTKEKLGFVYRNLVRYGVSDRDAPAPRLLNPFASLYTRVEAHLLAEAIFYRYIVEILPHFVVSWQDFSPLGIGSKGEAVEQARDIAGAS